MYVVFCFFFFKQKTAYEMRISDWSSDVCSSDLRPARWADAGHHRLRASVRRGNGSGGRCRGADAAPDVPSAPCHCRDARRRAGACPLPVRTRRKRGCGPAPSAGGRSEEHTSELQSLMRISYAVFCLKKKKKKK